MKCGGDAVATPPTLVGVDAPAEAEWPNEITSEQAMLAAYDVLSRIFGQRAVVNAYYRTDPDTMAVRDEDDEFFKHVKFFGYDDPKED